MSLNWDISAVRNLEKKKKDLVIGNAIDPMIWLTMAIGINEITNANRREVYLRIKLYEAAGGMSYSYSEDQLTKYPELKKHAKNTWAESGQISSFSQEVVDALVGLRTNASTKTRAEFAKMLWRIVDDKTKEDAKANSEKELAVA